MKLENWNEWDKSPAKTRFVKNEIELSERRMKKILDSAKQKAKKEVTILFMICMVTSLVQITVLIRHEWSLRRFHNFLLHKKSDSQ